MNLHRMDRCAACGKAAEVTMAGKRPLQMSTVRVLREFAHPYTPPAQPFGSRRTFVYQLPGIIRELPFHKTCDPNVRHKRNMLQEYRKF